MNLLRTSTLLVAIAGAVLLAPANRAVSASAPNGVAVLQGYAGKWVSDGQFTRTPYSKDARVTGVTTCNWSPMRNSLVCDQLVRSGASEQRSTSLYAWDAPAGAYRYAEFPLDGTPPHITDLKIVGDTWSYSGGFGDDKVTVLFRTVDVFTGDLEKWREEFSLDNGKKWIQMGAGSAKRVGN